MPIGKTPLATLRTDTPPWRARPARKRHFSGTSSDCGYYLEQREQRAINDMGATDITRSGQVVTQCDAM